MAYTTLEHDGPVAILKFGADGRRFLDADACAEIEAQVNALAQDPGVRAVILASALPGVFATHYSVEELVAMADGLKGMEGRFHEGSPAAQAAIDRYIAVLETMEKPVIAAIAGHCMGGGFETALGCDLRIAEAGDYRIGLPETRLGILPGAGGTQKLARMLGVAGALEIAMCGYTLGPDQAHAKGLVHECTGAGGALARALEKARDLANLPGRAVGHVKRLVRQAFDQPLTEGLRRERALFMDLMTRAEARRLMADYVAGKADDFVFKAP